MKDNFHIIAKKDQDTKRLKRLFTNVSRMKGGKEILSGINLECSVELVSEKSMPSTTVPATYDQESNLIRLNSDIADMRVLGRAFRDALKLSLQTEHRLFPPAAKRHSGPKI